MHQYLQLVIAEGHMQPLLHQLNGFTLIIFPSPAAVVVCSYLCSNSDDLQVSVYL